MKKASILLNQFATKENTIESYVSFRKFILFLEEKMQTDSDSRIQFYQLVLDKMRSFPELMEDMTISSIENYNEILELVTAVTLPLLDDENEALVGLAVGISPTVFQATNAFHKLFEPTADGNSPELWLKEESLLEVHYHVQADFILKKVYGYVLPDRKEITYSFFNSVTGLYQYYRLNIDSRFVEVKLKPGKEAANLEAIGPHFANGKGFEEIHQLLPVDNYIASGFVIVSLTDVTVQQSIDAIGKAIVSTKTERGEDNYTHVTRLLQTIVGSSEYRFGMMPFFTINKRAALPYKNFSYSIIVEACAQAGISKATFTRYLNYYFQNLDLLVYEPDSKVDAKNVLPIRVQHALRAAGIYYYRLTSVFFNGSLIGIMEISAGKGVASLTDMQVSKLKPALPFISQLLKQIIEGLNVSIDTIIKNKFTNIQPSVQWKFNEVAWHYFRSHDIEHNNDELEKIFFKDVHPLYGAIDIRNSTIERNKALREDLEYQLESVIGLLGDLKKKFFNEELVSAIGFCRQWIQRIQTYVSVEEELELNNFLYNQIQPLLRSFNDLPEALSTKLETYDQSIDEHTGRAFEKRRKLENSIQTLNRAIGKYLDLFKDEVQILYPSYFEKFRTDGVEYDIYIGQSISPEVAYSPEYLDKLRLWQVQSMAALAKLTSLLLPQLPHPLQTTQLIFVNARTIDISFRDDERRFDTEGTYNIRYHIIKKRIDKVHIRNSTERLTQPGKIAIVYFNEKDAILYSGYIQQLQQEQILNDDLEHLELEALQGVTGLKALRVGVKMD